MTDLPDLLTGVYQHYKGPKYLVLGYGHDANQEGRAVVIYVGLELTGAKIGARLAVRTVDDFFAIVDRETGAALTGWPYPSPFYPRRFTYLGPTWEG